MNHKLYCIFIMSLLVCCKQLPKPIELVDGVSRELADYRKQQISNVKYNLAFHMPLEREKAIHSRLILTLNIHNLEQPLFLDFKSNRQIPQKAMVNDKNVQITYQDEHLIIPIEHLSLGTNKIEIEFNAGEISLNRKDDYMYTLLVPDRARTLFPCFDQPNIKATYTLNMTIPEHWDAVSSALLEKTEKKEGFVNYQFKESDSMSTYLFSFVTGTQQKVSSTDTKLPMTLYYQEQDEEKIKLSIPEIFDLHQKAIDYLENYTDYKFPFQKLDYATVFSHPYGGMEHIGAIQYRQSSLFLDHSDTKKAVLRRAKLISHETAHMWFGNLVTMPWFNDVWMKEVFANFMADKIVNPNFKDINHPLSFFIDHYPAAYSVDLTRGTNPIRQKLNNLKNAGSLYGSIIYHKAPIMFRQLESLIGESVFQKGVSQYIKTYAYDNANWNDLIDILDKKTNIDLKKWSNVWVNSSGCPLITSKIIYDDHQTIQSMILEQKSMDGTPNIWQQVFEMTFIYPDSLHTIQVNLKDKENIIQSVVGLPKPKHILYNSDAMGYGLFPINTETLAIAIEIKSEVARASLYLNYYEHLLNGNISIEDSFKILEAGLKNESNELILSMLSSKINHLFWRYLPEKKRSDWQKNITETLYKRLFSEEKPNIKKTLFRLFSSFAYQGNAREQLYQIWRKELSISNLIFNRDNFHYMAMNLALYKHPKSKEILETTRSSLKDPNKIKRFDFLLPALSEDAKVREQLFQSFSETKNRENENWVLSACAYIHHPLRQKSGIKSLKLSLDLIEEIQKTGDIFFPTGWLKNTIGKYTSKKAYQILNTFLETHPNLNQQLKLKILQTTNDLYRINNK